MKTNLVLIPQTECDFVNALREYEAAHKSWMETPVASDRGDRAKQIKDEARAKYLAAYRAHYPSHIVM